LAAGTEVGRYRLLTVLFLPLYTRLHKEALLDNETRGMIRGFIYADPGIHYNEILRRLKLGNGTAAHHLMVLEREGLIKSRNDGNLKRFYPAEMRIVDVPPRLNDIQLVILKKVQESEGLSQREIARILELPHTTIHRQVTRMAELGVLRLEKDGLAVKCYLSENGHGTVDKNQ
jgi:predicted transcriptional regulator